MTAPRPGPPPSVAPAFPPDVTSLAVRLYLGVNLSYQDVEELLGECGIEVAHIARRIACRNPKWCERSAHNPTRG
jgi:transposase-like protein